MSVHKYPGLGLNLRHDPQGDYGGGHYPIGAHESCAGAESKIIMVRELAMMAVMETLTDKKDWHKKVFDDEIVAKWRKEAMSVPDDKFAKAAYEDKHQSWDDDGNITLQSDWNMTGAESKLKNIMSENTFDCCIQELRSKAKYYEQSGITPTLDASASVAKSDTLVTPKLHESLLTAFDILKKHHAASPDWHPSTNEQVQDLVHPSMYCLVYGRSKVIKEEVVGISDAIKKWAGKGEIIPKPRDGDTHGEHRGSGVPRQYWSENYQWLPANVAFQPDGGVKFTSYINGLHPNKFPGIYRTLERLIETALPMWDQCLAVTSIEETNDGAGRVEPRMGYPDNPDDNDHGNWDPAGPEDLEDVGVDWSDVDSDERFDPEYDDETMKKWELLRKPVIPEPSFEDVNYTPAPEKHLSEKFRDSGLQIIVKIASIELTPEKPEFPVGGWHIEGQMNEHICGTALYYLDSENVTSSDLSFRMQTSSYLNDDIEVGQDSFSWLEHVYGTSLSVGGSPCLQNYGSVKTIPGRLLAFPNVFQHRVSPFRLEDPTKPGYRRFIALWLVDPTQRIISTANVPPQQASWWLESLMGHSPASRAKALESLPPDILALLHKHESQEDLAMTGEGKFPAEVFEMVEAYFNEDREGHLMTEEEAREHRVSLMRERGAFVRLSGNEWQQSSYSFCEH